MASLLGTYLARDGFIVKESSMRREILTVEDPQVQDQRTPKVSPPKRQFKFVRPSDGLTKAFRRCLYQLSCLFPALTVDWNDLSVLAMALAHDRGKGAFPRQGLVAQRLGFSERFVRRAFSRLRQAGLADVDHRQGYSSRYSLSSKAQQAIKSARSRRQLGRGSAANLADYNTNTNRNSKSKKPKNSRREIQKRISQTRALALDGQHPVKGSLGRLSKHQNIRSVRGQKLPGRDSLTTSGKKLHTYILKWHQRWGSTKSDEDLSGMIGGAMRCVGEEQVREIYNAMVGDKHPGDFWKVYRSVKRSGYGSKPSQSGALPSDVIRSRFFGEDI